MESNSRILASSRNNVFVCGGGKSTAVRAGTVESKSLLCHSKKTVPWLISSPPRRLVFKEVNGNIHGIISWSAIPALDGAR